MNCRVTGKPIEKKPGRGRTPEYVSDDARAFAFRMTQLQTLIASLRDEMTPEMRKHWRAEIWRMANLLNGRD